MTVKTLADFHTLLESAGFKSPEYRDAVRRMILLEEVESDNEVYFLKIRGFAVREGCLLVFVDPDQCIGPAPDQRIMYLVRTPLEHWRVFQMRHRHDALQGGGIPAAVKIV
jgi:hypothetical protein